MRQQLANFTHPLRRHIFYPSPPNGGCAPRMVEFGVNLRSCTMKGFGIFILIAGICWVIFAEVRSLLQN